VSLRETTSVVAADVSGPSPFSVLIWDRDREDCARGLDRSRRVEFWRREVPVRREGGLPVCVFSFVSVIVVLRVVVEDVVFSFVIVRAGVGRFGVCFACPTAGNWDGSQQWARSGLSGVDFEAQAAIARGADSVWNSPRARVSRERARSRARAYEILQRVAFRLLMFPRLGFSVSDVIFSLSELYDFRKSSGSEVFCFRFVCLVLSNR
jgi:hypothetical protein